MNDLHFYLTRFRALLKDGKSIRMMTPYWQKQLDFFVENNEPLHPVPQFGEMMSKPWFECDPVEGTKALNKNR